jgi:predicted RecA/RadA family phage recombinase
MSTNETFRSGDKLSLPVPDGRKSGDPVRVGSLNGVLATDKAKVDVSPTNADGTRNTDYNYGGGNVTGNASVWLVGAHDVPVSTTTTRAIGDPIYIITASNVLTTTDNSGANPLFGHAVEAKSATANEVIRVRIAN